MTDLDNDNPSFMHFKSNLMPNQLNTLAFAPKQCCNHDCDQGDECPIRAAREDLFDDTGYLIGRGILLVMSILTIALGVYHLFA